MKKYKKPIILGIIIIIVLCLVLVVNIRNNQYKKAIDNMLKFEYQYETYLIGRVFPQEVFIHLEEEEGGDVLYLTMLLDSKAKELEQQDKQKYGKNIKFSYKVTSKEKLSYPELTSLREELNDTYQIYGYMVEEAYNVDIDYIVKGNKNSEKMSLENLTVVKIGDNWYVWYSSGYWSDFYCSSFGRFS